MTARNHPWLVSFAAHALLAVAAVSLLRIPEAPAPVRMHLSPPGSAKAPRASMTMPAAAASNPAAPALPSWRDHAPPSGAQKAPTVPVSLEELLGDTPADTAPEATGWISEGYAPPPLPPPELAPPQGARWSLTVSVPAGGGPGAVEGLDSGHPELDRWLEEYLRSVSFPPGLGQPYQVRWNLRLVSDRPR